MSEVTDNLIGYINSKFTDNVNDNNKEMVRYVIPYLLNKHYTIDDSLELLENCPKLFKTVSESKSSSFISELLEDSTLYIAYQMMSNEDVNEELNTSELLKSDEENTEKADEESNSNDALEYDYDFDEVKYYIDNKDSISKDIDYLALYLKEISLYKLLSYEETTKLFEKLETATGTERDTIRNEIANHNLRLSVNIAKKFRGNGVAFLDLIQAGNEGLFLAINKFKYKKGYRFSTYATWWIKQAVSRCIANNSRTIRIPSYMYEKIFKLKKIEKYLTNNDDYSLEKLSFMSGIPVEKILDMKRYSEAIASLDEPICNFEGDEDTSLGEMVPSYDTEMEGVSDKLFEEEFRNEIFNSGILTERQKKIIELRFGFVDGKIKTLEETGKIIGVTRERVRQIEVKALSKLRNYFKRRKYEKTDLLSDSMSDYSMSLK